MAHKKQIILQYRTGVNSQWLWGSVEKKTDEERAARTEKCGRQSKLQHITAL